MKSISVSAPGRVCLFGEDQDYLGLAVIPVAISLRTYVSGHITDNDLIKIKYRDTNKFDQFCINEKIEYGEIRDYLRATINVLKRDERCKELLKGVNCEVWSEVPIAAGLSSSSALVVAWVKFLTSVFKLPLNEEEIALIAYNSEVTEFGEPGGMMDHFASTLGGLLHIKCTEPPRIEKLDTALSGFVIGDTLVQKNTLETLNQRKSEIYRGIHLISRYVNDFNLETADLHEIEPYLSRLDISLAKRLKAVIKMRDIVKSAVEVLRHNNQEQIDQEQIGELMNLHHKYMREGFENSIPKAEKLIKASLNAGALGGKITGSGNGGCVIIYAPDCQQEVSKAIEKVGGKAYIVEVAEGARDEFS